MLNYLLAPTFQYINTAGRPLSGGAYLEVYIHGTRTKYYCASDFEGNLHPFQIPLDSLGANVVLAEDTGSYDVYAYNRYGSLIMSRYNVKPGAGGGSGMGTITSSDGSIEVTPTSTGVDLKVNGQEPSVLRATADDLDADGTYTFSALVIDGDELSVDENGRIRMEDGWYHYDATVRLVWEDSVNDSATVQLYTTLNSDVMEFDLSYAHDETVQWGGEMKITTGGTSFVLGVSGLPNGMVAQLVDLGIHTITGHGDAAGYEAGDGIIIDDHEISIDPSVVQEKLTAGDNIQISEENVISATDTTYTAGDGLSLNGTEFTVDVGPNLYIDPNTHKLGAVDTLPAAGYGLSKSNYNTLDVDTSVIQEKLTAGSNIQINNNTISATDTTYSAGNGLTLSGTEFAIDTSVVATKSDIPEDEIFYVDVTDPDYDTALAAYNAGKTLVLKGDYYTGYLCRYTPTDGLVFAYNLPWMESGSPTATQVGYLAMRKSPDTGNTYWHGFFSCAIPNAIPADSGKVLTVSGSNVASWTSLPDLTPYVTDTELSTILEGYQPELTAGQNITITNNVISADAAPQLQSNWTENDSSSVQYIQNKPVEKSLVPGANISISEGPTEVTISATAAPQVQADWTEDDSSAVSYIKHKPTLAAVATSGSYNDLSNTPSIPSVGFIDL